MRFADMQNTLGSSSGLTGVHLLKPGVPLSVQFLAKGNALVIKPSQAVSEEGALLPARDPNDQDSPTEWYTGFPSVIRGAGIENSRKVTFINALPENSEFPQTPYDVLYHAIKAKSADSGYRHLEDLLKGGNNRSPAMPKADACGFIQGTIYMAGGKDFSSNPRQNCLVVIPTSGIASAGKLFSQRNADGSYALPDLFIPNYAPLFLHIMMSGTMLTLPPNWSLVMGSESEESAASNEGRFNRYIFRVLTGPANIRTPSPEVNISSWVPWNKAFQILSAQEQVAHLCHAFPPNIVQLGFAHSPFFDMIPNWVHKTGSQSASLPTTVDASIMEPQVQSHPVAHQAPQFHPAAQAPQKAFAPQPTFSPAVPPNFPPAQQPSFNPAAAPKPPAFAPAPAFTPQANVPSPINIPNLGQPQVPPMNTAEAENKLESTLTALRRAASAAAANQAAKDAPGAA